MSNFGFDFRAPMRVNHMRWLVFKVVDDKPVLMGKTADLAKAEELMEALGATCWAERIGAERSEAA